MGVKRNGDVILVDIERTKVSIFALCFSPYQILPEFGILSK